MNPKVKPLIVIIDDSIKSADEEPLVAELEDKYGIENVKIFQHSIDGINFVEANLSKKIIVILDIMFGNKPEGFNVFEKITKQTSLVCFVVRTGNSTSNSIPRGEYINLINKHAWYIINSDENSEKTLAVIENANQYLSYRIDGALEEWIMRHSPEERDKPYLRTRSGQTHSLNQILTEVRMGTEFGREMAYSILNLTIDQLARDKKVI